MDLATLQYSASIDTLTLVEPYNSTNYLPEDAEYSSVSFRPKFSDTVIIDIQYLKSSKSEDVISHKVTSRTDCIEDTVVEIPLTEDGHIINYHFVMPTQKWANEGVIQNQLLQSSYVYYDTDRDLIFARIYKASEGGIQVTYDYEISDPEFITIYNDISKNWDSELDKKIPNDSDILHLFITNKLRKCYVQTSYKALSGNINCNTDEDLRYRRDLIHMAYTVIQYQVDLNHYDEAQLLYEEFTKCGGLCSDFTESSDHYGCGCSKK